jgi:hypothetical protein
MDGDGKTISKWKGISSAKIKFVEGCFRQLNKECIVEKEINVGFKTVKINSSRVVYKESVFLLNDKYC